MKSATASRAVSSSRSLSWRRSPGSPSISDPEFGHCVHAVEHVPGCARRTRPPTPGRTACPAGTGPLRRRLPPHRPGGAPRRCRPGGTAAPNVAISSPPTPSGTPLASHRVNTCRSGSHTLVAETEPLGHLHRGQAVRHQAPLDRLAAGDDQVGGEAEPVRGGVPAPTWRSARTRSKAAQRDRRGSCHCGTRCRRRTRSPLPGCRPRSPPRPASSRSTAPPASSAFRSSRSAEPAAITHDRSTCSIGCPSPRSVASEKAATSSASRSPES